MEIGASTGTATTAIQPQQTSAPQQQAQQEQQSAELEVARSEPDPEQRTGTLIDTQA